MAEKKTGKELTKSETAALSKELEGAAEQDLTRGIDELAAARDVAEVSREVAMDAASDVTLGAAEFRVSRAAGTLGEMAAAGAVIDLVQASEVLLTSDEVAEMAGAIRGMSADDLERALDLGGISGQLAVVSDLAYGLEMITLGQFLEQKSRQVRGHAVEAALLMQGNRELARSMRKVSNRMAGVGVTELARAGVKLEVADALQAKSEELAEQGADDIALALDEARAADSLSDVAGAMARRGVEDVAAGSAELGASLMAEEAEKKK
jgi:hypothetical protein